MLELDGLHRKIKVDPKIGKAGLDGWWSRLQRALYQLQLWSRDDPEACQPDEKRAGVVDHLWKGSSFKGPQHCATPKRKNMIGGIPIAIERHCL
jgi:hypothetical protein